MQNDSDSNKNLAKRFLYRCVVCFGHYNEIHHIVPKSLGGEDVAENKVPLCQKHHKEIHRTGAINHIKKLTELRAKRLKEFES